MWDFKKNKAILTVLKHAYKPEIVLFFNKTKDSVDRFDQIIEHSSCRRRTNRWTFNAVWYMIDVADHKAFLLFKFKNPLLFLKNDYQYIIISVMSVKVIFCPDHGEILKTALCKNCISDSLWILLFWSLNN